MQQQLMELGISQTGTQKDRTYTINFSNFEEFSNVFLKLEKNNELEKEESETSEVTEETIDITFHKGNLIINLYAELSNDVYILKAVEGDFENDNTN